MSRLVNSVQDRNVCYALIGSRQIGKTRILREFARRVGEKAIVVRLDFSVNRYSPEDFSSALIQSLTDEYAKRVGGRKRALSHISSIFQMLKDIQRLRFSIVIEADEQGKPQISIKPELAEEKRVNKKELVELAFAYATKIAEESRTQVVVIIDEFQYLADFASYPGLKSIMEIFRHTLDERGNNVSYIVSGSRIHFLTHILSDGKSPLFGRFTIIPVGELEEKYTCELYMKARKNASLEEARLVYELVGGHPFYLLTLAENKHGDETPRDTYQRLLSEPTGAFNLYARYIIAEDLGSHAKARQSRFLKILHTLGDRTMPVSEISKQTKIVLTSLPWYLQQLISYDLVAKSKDGYSVKEKVLRDYLTITTDSV
ncbi:MAG: AAA family ATPase [Thaumarchaeota archaeon]|nr:AAA family ATPase [Nitrososphaerota archaeon]